MVLPGALAAPRVPLELDETPFPEGFHQFFPSENIEVFGKVEEEVFQLALLARLCAHEVEALFGDNRPPGHLLSFYAMNISYEENAFRYWDIPLRVTEPLEAVVAGMLQGLLLRQLRERLEINVRRNAIPHSIVFLSAALANRMVIDGKGIKGIYRKDYRIPRLQFSRGSWPSCAKLLGDAPPASSPLLFRLYLVHCDVLLSCLEHQSGHRLNSMLLEWWRLEVNQKIPSDEAFAKLLGLPAEHLQQWYLQNASVQAKQGVGGAPAETIAAQLYKLLTVSVVELGDAKPMRTVKIEELPGLLKNRRPDVSALNAVQLDLLRLKLVATPIYHTAIDYFSLAVSALAHNDIKLFRRRYTAAQKELEKAVPLQREITGLLDETEREMAPDDAIRGAVWHALLRHRNELRMPMELASGIGE